MFHNHSYFLYQPLLANIDGWKKYLELRKHLLTHLYNSQNVECTPSKKRMEILSTQNIVYFCISLEVPIQAKTIDHIVFLHIGCVFLLIYCHLSFHKCKFRERIEIYEEKLYPNSDACVPKFGRPNLGTGQKNRHLSTLKPYSLD